MASKWSNEKVLKFLDLYSTEPALWDPQNKNYRLKHKVHDAWARISYDLDNGCTPIEELKAKRKALMATFRPLIKRKKISIRSGAGADEIFQPTWFAYDIMESFLGSLYDFEVDNTINTEDGSSHSELWPAQAPTPTPTLETSLPSPSQSVSSAIHIKPIKTKRNSSLNEDEAQNKICQSLDTLNQVIRQKRNDKNYEDECYIYGKFIGGDQKWSNEKVLKFLELYATEPVLWDPQNKNHKLRHKVLDAWARISYDLDNTPIEELKAKRKALMATFRPLLKRKINSIRSGAGADEIFQPIWFAYDVMESFLGYLYDVDNTINTEDGSAHSEVRSAQAPTPTLEAPTLETPLPSPSHSVSSSIHIKPIKTKRNTRLNLDAQNKIFQISLDTLNEVIRQKRNDKNDEDECDIYGKLIAKRLRKYPESMRAKMMYKIDGYLLANPCPVDPISFHSSNSSQSHYSGYQISTPSPVHVITPESPQSNYIYARQPQQVSEPDGVEISIPDTDDTPLNTDPIETA